MTWNWQQADWPNFSYDPRALELLEQQFLRHSGEVIGAARHVGPDDQEALRIELISEEAVKTSQIEGEILTAIASNHLCAINSAWAQISRTFYRPNAASRR